MEPMTETCETIPVQSNVIVIDRLCKGCGICVDFCPTKALKSSNKVTQLGSPIPTLERPENCVKCEICEMLCPDYAIFVVK